jgi:hypothetical protein
MTGKIDLCAVEQHDKTLNNTPPGGNPFPMMGGVSIGCCFEACVQSRPSAGLRKDAAYKAQQIRDPEIGSTRWSEEAQHSDRVAVNRDCPPPTRGHQPKRQFRQTRAILSEIGICSPGYLPIQRDSRGPVGPRSRKNGWHSFELRIAQSFEVRDVECFDIRNVFCAQRSVCAGWRPAVSAGRQYPS